MQKNISRKHHHFRPTVFKLLATDDKYTAASGLASIIEVFDDSNLSSEFKKCLPKRISNKSAGSYRLGLCTLSSMIYGHDSLDDLEEFREDPFFEEALQGEIAAPRTIGDFLRDFTDSDIENLNKYLTSMSYAIREQLQLVQPEEFKPSQSVTIDIDSTSHIQQGDLMEGLAWNYKNEWCLDSQVAFDELGFCFGLQLRPGNAKSGTNAEELIKQCFTSKKHSEKKSFRADSAYCNQTIIGELLNKGAEFTITLNEATTDINQSDFNQITEWKKWEYSEKEITSAQIRKKELPRIELGRLYWEPSWSKGTLKFPVIVKRTWIKDPGLFDGLAGFGSWKYYAVITNHNMFEKSYQEVMQFHQKRGNSENFIREEKYGYDLKHFPCQKLRANHAYGLLMMVAHNILRWVALIQKPDKPHFSKKIRRRFIYIPGRVIKHARQVFLKIPTRFYEEVKRIKEALQLQPLNLQLNTS